MKRIVSLDQRNRIEQLFTYFRRIIHSGMYAEGQFITGCESRLTKILNTPTYVLNSCGSALYLMFLFYQRQGHTRVVVQNNTFYATGAMAAEAGLIPVLCDSCYDCPSMSVDSLREAVEQTGATLVCLTHIGGWIAKDYEAIAIYCKKNGLTLVEDCAHAFGLTQAGIRGEAACWSFYPTKALPIGEGGAISTQREDLQEFVRRFRSYGKSRQSGVIYYTRGMNLRMSEWNAAVLQFQLNRFPKIWEARQRDARALQSIAPCLLEGESNYYKYPVEAKHAFELQTTGKVYARTDQLDMCLWGTVLKPVPLLHSWEWSEDHACLPIGEDLYADMSESEIRQRLRVIW